MSESLFKLWILILPVAQMALKNAIKYIDMYTLELPEWLGAKKDFRGNPCKDLKDFINLIGDDADATRQQFLYRKAKARRVKFWSRNDKGEYAINRSFITSSFGQTAFIKWSIDT